MQDYVSNITLADAAKLILASPRVLLTTHAKPDGDAFGAVVALSSALRILGREAEAVFMPPVPAALESLRGANTVKMLTAGEKLPDADLAVILDTGAWSQLAPIREGLAARLDKTLIVDHHLGGDVSARHRYIDSRAASSCEIVGELIDALAAATHKAPDELLNAVVADALFVGIASDTGWFRFSNTRPQTHELAARLQRLGVNHAELYQKLEQTDRPEKLLLLIKALSSLRLIAGGRAAVMVLRRDDFAQSGALVEETERFVDVPQTVEAVEVVVLIVEPPMDGSPAPIRVSFRSKPGPKAVNVADLAKPFGGGGHARAAGAKIDAPFEQTLERIIDAVSHALNGR